MGYCSLKGKPRLTQWLKLCQEDARHGSKPEDRQFLQSYLVKKPNKEDSSSKSRSDVITKKVLRAARSFYDYKIEEICKYKKQKHKFLLHSFLTFTDMIVDEFFSS